MDNKKVIEIASLFLATEKIKSAKPFGDGHINDTFLIEIAESGRKYILQKINKNVFKTPAHVIHNIELYLHHLHKKK